MEKQYDFRSCEAVARQLWEQEKTYQVKQDTKPVYSIDTPPPTVSGALHIGHIFSYTQTDIIARYKRMSGYAVFYPFGFDDNGLPTEKFVEKKHNIIAHNLSRSAFIELCLKETGEVEKKFEDLWRAIGLSADWNAIYSTISPTTRKISQESFIRLYNKGYVYRKSEPALYCTTCRTTVAQAELDDKEVASTFNDVVFKDEQGNELIVGTTRPELLPSASALLYHPQDPRYKHLKGKHATVPVFNFTVPIYADEAVQQDKGSGLVFVSSFGDKTDIAWVKKFNLPYKQSIGLDGRWLPSTGPLAGLKVHLAREKILELLKEQGLLKSQKPIMHNVNVHERCKKEIEYLIIPQWFIAILPYKDKFLELADTIEWYPSFMKTRYQNWVTNLGWDWGISRQRFFGIPFPAWHCNNCNEILLADIKYLPIDPQESAYPGGKCTKCSSTDIRPDHDVMDTWNTSSLTPYICKGLFEKTDSVFEKTSSFLPMSMRPQAHDIIRTWAFYTIIKSWMHQGSIPWKDIVISGHVLSDSKEKLSKSKENAKLTPEHLLETYSADAIRYWTASGSLGHDVPFSENQLKIGLRLITKLWNAFRFIHEHIGQSKPAEVKNLGVVNEWILHRAAQTFDMYQHQYKAHEFGLALHQIEPFFWNDFCDNYLELVKDQLFHPELYTAEQVNATKYTLYTVGLQILQWYAPYLPYITETIYQQIYKSSVGSTSVHTTQFKDIQKTYNFPDSVLLLNAMLAIINGVRKLKTEKQLSLKVELATLTCHIQNEDLVKQLKSVEQLLKGVTRAHTIQYDAQIIPNMLEQQHNETWIADVSVSL